MCLPREIFSLKSPVLSDKENIEFILDSVLLSAEAAPVIKSITVENKTTGEKSELSVNGLFMAIGQTPLTAEFAGILPLDSYGYVQTGEDCTVRDGVYVCGDCRKKDIRQLTTAASDGTVAAMKAVEYVDSNR